MRLKTYLNERILTDYIDNMKKDCKPFINELKQLEDGLNSRFVYRGMVNTDAVGVKKVRKNRIPKDTPIKGHKILDNIFKKNFGWKARSEGLFCVGSYSDALAYGTVYAIFPVGRYKLLWSDEIQDLYMDIRYPSMRNIPSFKGEFDYKLIILWDDQYRWDVKRIIERIYDKSKVESVFQEVIEDAKKKLNEYIGNNYSTSNLKKYFDNPHNELTIKCDKYYYLHHRLVNENLKQIFDKKYETI